MVLIIQVFKNKGRDVLPFIILLKKLSKIINMYAIYTQNIHFILNLVKNGDHNFLLFKNYFIK